MRVLFAGSPSIAVPSLEVLCNMEGVELAGVLTNCDSPKGRHGTPLPTGVGEAAVKILQQPEKHPSAVPDFSVLKPQKLDAAAREQVCALKPDLLVSFAYGHIFGPKFLSLFPLGGINIHPSLLPKYRGPAPIQAAILNRDAVTGITIQSLAEEMDSGDILAQEQLQLTGVETCGALSGVIAQKAAQMLGAVLRDIAAGKTARSPQNHSEASYCSLVSRKDALIDWSRSAAEIDAKIRAFDPWPACWTVHNGKDLLILKASIYENGASCRSENVNKPGRVLGIDKQGGILVQTGEGILLAAELQYQGKKALKWQAFLNGARDFIGSTLGLA